GGHQFNVGGKSGAVPRHPGFMQGSQWEVEWVPVENPHEVGCYGRGLALGGATFSRGEGCWYDSGRVYFVSTDGGTARKGQVFMYRSEERRVGKGGRSGGCESSQQNDE